MKVHVISHTHWDREWYQDFQGFRQRLVFQTDAMLDVLDNYPAFACFHLDGQTCCVLDCLEISTDNESRLREQLSAGRVSIGPWFVMPDELLLSGESLVRNLMLGHKICRDFGVAPMPIGHVSDIFGHCSQLPQILAGFGIDSVLLNRGTTAEDDETSEMIWVGADGTESIIVRAFPDTGYQDFLTMRDADDEALLKYEAKKRALSATGISFALDGNDHQPARPDTLRKIEHFNSLFDKSTWLHSSMVDFLDDLKAHLTDEIRARIKHYHGELRHPAKQGLYNECFNGTASSRVPLKQANDRIEYLLATNAEQINAWAVLCGGDDGRKFLDRAWRYLLLNHPHDSIVGCSLDQIHKDMIYRFDQARLIAEHAIWENVQAIDDALDTAALGADAWIVTVHNQSSSDLGPVAHFTFDVLSDEFRANRDRGMKPALFDESGNQIRFAVESVEHDRWRQPFVRKVKGETSHYLTVDGVWLGHERYHAAAAVSVPAFGFRTLRVGFVPDDDVAPLPEGVGASVVAEDGKGIENGLIELRVNGDATIDILDKPTGRWYRGLHRIEDRGDKGTGWDHFFPKDDRTIESTTPGAVSDVRIEAEALDGVTASVTIGYKMTIPAGLTPDREGRSEECAVNTVRTRFSLDAGARRVDCVTEIDNAAECHRMRAIFPTGLECDTWFGDSAYDIVERPIKLRDTTGWKEPAREETPVKNFAAAVGNDGCGLALITKGLCEACVRDNDTRDLALTLFRSFSEFLYGYWTEDSQLKGKLRLEYSILPFTRTDSVPLDVLREAERVKTHVFAFSERATPGTIAPTGRFLKIDGGVFVSAVKTSEDGEATIVRLFNPDASAHRFRLEFTRGIESAWLCDFVEKPLNEIEHDGSVIKQELGPKKIKTLRIVSS